MSNRWNDYVSAYADEIVDSSDPEPVERLWAAAAETAAGRSLYALGVGFDPRCLVGLQKFLALGLDAPLIVRFELPPPSEASHAVARTLATDNLRAFAEMVKALSVKVIPYPAVHERVNAGPQLARSLVRNEVMNGVEHVFIDISSMPSSLYFPIIAAALRVHDQRGHPTDIQVVACENPAIDAAILELGISEGSVVGGFRGHIDVESEPSGIRIWAPVIGENSEPALRAIHAFLNPRETTPVLPFPARDPRRADRLLLEHQRVFDEFQISPGDIIYADERNPFDLYRTLAKLQEDYKSALASLEETVVVPSAHSSKLLSLGVLLASYEYDLPIASAAATDYMIHEGADFAALGQGNAVGCLWLTGDPYA